ncbi:MAG: (Fe-S)-binding protein [Armatimonadetes bacterium]|nr:(Fe-S)-binding protein [Armatimonadota bacterium]
MSSFQLADLEEELLRCMKCGNCQAVCPLYKATREEPLVARGKIRLAEAVLLGEIDCTPKIARRFEECLTCLACMANCPSGVRYDRLIIAARAAAAQKRGLPRLLRSAALLLRRPRLFRLALRAAGKTQGLLFRREPAGGQSPRFRLVAGRDRILPRLAPRPYLDLVPEIVSPAPGTVREAGAGGLKVAFFPGCLANYVYPQTARAATELLTSFGVTVVTPRPQHCCGMPVFIHGDLELMRKIAGEQVRLFSGVDCAALVTVCPTCGEAFLHYYPALLTGEPGERARTLAEKTMDMTDFLIKYNLGAPEVWGPVPGTVTYHSPCHLDRGMGVYKQPLELIKKVPETVFRPLREPTTCCGGAGAFTFTNRGLSELVLNPKVADIRQTGAQTVLTGCSACRMQLAEALAKAGLAVEVLHTVEFLARAQKEKSGLS